VPCHEHTRGAGSEITCLNDVPSVARLAARQQLLAKWYHAIALVPFTIVVFVGVKFFGDSTNRFLDVLVGATLLWAIAVAVYTF